MSRPYSKNRSSAQRSCDAAAEDANVRVLDLLSDAYIEGVDSYIGLMEFNMEQLVEGLGGRTIVAQEAEGLKPSASLPPRRRPVRDLLSVTTGRPALESVTFDVPEGSLVGSRGRTVSGSRRCLKTLLRLLRPWRGEISLFGQPAASMRGRIGTRRRPSWSTGTFRRRWATW